MCPCHGGNKVVSGCFCDAIVAVSRRDPASPHGGGGGGAASSAHDAQDPPGAVTPEILGIVNITEDSFSDGGLHLRPQDAICRGLRLLEEGADILDLGAAASNPSARPVPPATEIARLRPVMEALRRRGASLCVDSFATETQRFALAAGADCLNDIQGFADAGFYPELAAASCRLVVMHSVQRLGPATRRPPRSDPRPILEQVAEFFEERLAALQRAGVARERLILDPGMGLFLGAEAGASVSMLRALPALKSHFGLPVLVSVSRKSFLRQLSGAPLERIGAATLAGELFAAWRGADFLRTHEPRPLRDALAVWRPLAAL